MTYEELYHIHFEYDIRSSIISYRAVSHPAVVQWMLKSSTTCIINLYDMWITMHMLLKHKGQWYFSVKHKCMRTSETVCLVVGELRSSWVHPGQEGGGGGLHWCRGGRKAHCIYAIGFMLVRCSWSRMFTYMYTYVTMLLRSSHIGSHLLEK